MVELNRIEGTVSDVGGMYCPYCGSKMVYSVEHDRWFCPRCSGL